MKVWAKWFYNSDAWEKTRDAYFEHAAGLCEDCKEAGEIVHHIVHLTPQNIHDPKITLSWDNLKLVCRECHSKYHPKNKNKRNERYSVDEKGNILPPPSRKNNPFGNR